MANGSEPLQAALTGPLALAGGGVCEGATLSLRKRYAYKLGTNAVSLLINLVAQAIIPRGLGPSSFGSYQFLTNSFDRVIGFLEMGTSTCFYTELSRNQRDRSIVSFYLLYTVGIAVVLGLVVAASLWGRGAAALWPGQVFAAIALAAGVSLCTWIVGVFGRMNDAYGQTVPAEKMRMLQKALGLVLLMALFASGGLTLWSYFAYQYIALLLLAAALLVVNARGGHSLRHLVFPSRERMRLLGRQFFSYSRPLVLLGFFGLAAGFFDRWLLQHCGGGVEQGFYSLSFQVGAVCILFTSAMTPLFMRELSIAHGVGDRNRMTDLFRRSVPVLFSLAAFFSCFVAVNARQFTDLFGGSRYAGAMTAVAVMALYPMHQTLGQMCASVYYATGETKRYSRISMIFLFVGIPLTYVLVAPTGSWGVGAGATGLAIKMVLINILDVNVQLYFVVRILALPFWRYLGGQAIVFACFTGLSVGAAGIAGFVPAGPAGVLRLIVSGLLYVSAAATVVWYTPAMVGLEREDARNLVRMIADRVRQA